MEGCRGSQGGVGIIALALVFLVFLCVSDRSPLCEAGAGWGCEPGPVLAGCPLLSAVLGVPGRCWNNRSGLGFSSVFVCLARVPSVEPCRSGIANPEAVLADSGMGAAFGQCYLEAFGVAFPPVSSSWLRFLLVCHGAAFCGWHWNHSGACGVEAPVSTDFASGTLTA